MFLQFAKVLAERKLSVRTVKKEHITAIISDEKKGQWGQREYGFAAIATFIYHSF